MILVRNRRAEEGHDPVAHNPADGAFIAVDCLDHPFEHRVEELLRSLGVAIGKHLHRTPDIREEHGDLLAFTVDGCPCGEDLIGKVQGRVSLG
jgi:hypothetical protein